MAVRSRLRTADGRRRQRANPVRSCSPTTRSIPEQVVVVEHHPAVMAYADWIVDLGPGAGHDGGRIVFEGTPADLVAARSTLTGEHLAAYVRS